MICIACEGNFEALAKSHVISNFFRKRITGWVDEKGAKKFRFTWVDRKDLPNQDLPKPNLMCVKCDSKLGSIVESNIPQLLMPSDIDNWGEWEKLPITQMAIDNVFDGFLWVGVYNYPNEQQNILERFSLSTAWRALHDMSREGRTLSSEFLKSKRGQLFDKLAKGYIFENKSRGEVRLASLYFLGPNSAKIISGQESEMPFAWAELGEGSEFLGVGVFLGLWVILWPLFESSASDYFDKLNKLERLCFLNWVGKIKAGLDPNWTA